MAETNDLTNSPGAPSPTGTPEPAGTAQKQGMREEERLGDILRRVREYRGETLGSIAQYLCIRPNYLAALEKSRYGDLPADAYVIGFLRSYANYLGLDEQGAIDQYRREMVGRRHKPELTMPQPITEGRTPTLAFLGGGLLAMIVIYGIWYGLSTPEPTPETPLVEQKTISSPPAPTTAVPALKPQTLDVDPADIAPEKPEESSVFLENTKLPEVRETAPVLIEAEPKKEEAPAAKVETAPIQVAPATSVPPVLQSTATPSSFGDTNKPRIVLRATEETWVLVTDEKGLTVFDKTIRPGDSYGVPSQRNLRLTTGNPAGLGIAIDGKPMPNIQSTEKVARGIPLDPEKLKAFLSGKKASTESEEND